MDFMASFQSGLDSLKPSLFEILAEQQLAGLLGPSLRYILVALTHRYPRYLLRILNSFDEIYALFMLVVDRHHLKTFGGGFTEHFYGLKRERVLRVRGGEVPRAQLGAPGPVREALKLGSTDVWKSLAVMIGLPYVKRKLDESYNIHAAGASILGHRHYQESDSLSPNSRIKERLIFYYKWFIRRIYPSINAAYYFSTLAFNLAYLFDATKYNSPFLWLIKTRIRRRGAIDNQTLLKATTSAAVGGGLSRSRLGWASRGLVPTLNSSISLVLPASIFALQFLEWWHASDFARHWSKKTVEGLDLPPPTLAPSQATPARSGAAPFARSSQLPILTVSAPTPETSGLCPVCTKPISNATASPYGYVYCYVCIHQWAQGSHERQEKFMQGGDHQNHNEYQATEWNDEPPQSVHHGTWESGHGRDAVTGRKILGGSDMLRRVVV